MHTTDREGAVRAVLYERGELPPPAADRVDSVHERLETLAANDELASVDREEWVKRTPVDDCDGDLRDTYLSFTSWAENAGASLTPFFQTRECYSPDEGAHTDWLVMPAFCLALYEDDSVSAVYPHAEGSETYTVEDGLQALLVDDVEETRPEPATAD
jgi:hypothetical protein